MIQVKQFLAYGTRFSAVFTCKNIFLHTRQGFPCIPDKVFTCKNIFLHTRQGFPQISPVLDKRGYKITSCMMSSHWFFTSFFYIILRQTILSLGITVWHHSAVLMMPNSYLLTKFSIHTSQPLKILQSYNSPYKTIRILHGYEGQIEHSVPRVTAWLCLVMPNSHSEARNFLSALNTVWFFFLHIFRFPMFIHLAFMPRCIYF